MNHSPRSDFQLVQPLKIVGGAGGIHIERQVVLGTGGNDIRGRRERDIALSRFTAEQRAQMRQSEMAALRERQEAQRQQQQRQREEMMAAREAQQRAAKERMELCRLERERYGTSTSCNY